MVKKIYSLKIIINSTGIVLTFLFLFSCETQDKWSIKKREFDRTESYNYSEYVSGELDSTTKSQLEQRKQSLQQEQARQTPQEKKISKKTPKKPPPSKPSLIDRIWKSISDFIDSILNLF